MQNEDIVLELNQVNKSYGQNEVVKNVSFCLKKGHIYALVGQNGAGKTTIMRMIVGLAKPGSGECKVRMEEKESMGSLIERPAIYSNLTVRENIKIVELMQGITSDKKTEHLLQDLDITDQRKKVKNFSLGMKQKLGIVLALTGEPKLLVLDEPLNGLDPISMIQIRELLKKESERGATILISSHMLNELFKVATDFVFIDKGSIKNVMTYEDIIDTYGQDCNPEEVYIDIIGGGYHDLSDKK